MGQQLSDTLLSQVSQLIAAEMGLHFPRERWNDLERGVRSAAHESHFPDGESFCHEVLSSALARKQVEVLASHLTVGETYFFRQKEVFQVLETHILPQLIASRLKTDRRIRLWSAGCASGEEAYSLAMLLDRVVPNCEDWNLTILASDINPRFLQKAAAGVYTEWSFRDTPEWIKERYFEKRGRGVYEIHTRLKKMVIFDYLNLVADSFPSLLNNTNAVDILFCRNVLMYMVPAQAMKIVKNLHAAMMDGGVLVVSPSETANLFVPPFAILSFPDVVLYKKDSGVFHERESIQEFDSLALPWLQEVHEPKMPEKVFVPLAFPAQPGFEAPATALWVREGPLPHDLSSPSDQAAVMSSQTPSSGNLESVPAPMEESENADVMARRAHALANQGFLKEARECCEIALSSDKMKPALHYLRATILQEEGNVEEAAAEFKRTLYLDPDFVLAHFALGMAALRLGRRKQGFKHFANAVSILRHYPKDMVLSESDGMTAGRLLEIVETTTSWRYSNDENSARQDGQIAPRY